MDGRALRSEEAEGQSHGASTSRPVGRYAQRDRIT